MTQSTETKALITQAKDGTLNNSSRNSTDIPICKHYKHKLQITEVWLYHWTVWHECATLMSCKTADNRDFIELLKTATVAAEIWRNKKLVHSRDDPWPKSIKHAVQSCMCKPRIQIMLTSMSCWSEVLLSIAAVSLSTTANISSLSFLRRVTWQTAHMQSLLWRSFLHS
jgi:hypothetical protein